MQEGGGNLLKAKLVNDMKKKGLNPEYLNTPYMVVEGQGGVDDKELVNEYFEEGMR
jgi:hypothetical protein